MSTTLAYRLRHIEACLEYALDERVGVYRDVREVLRAAHVSVQELVVVFAPDEPPYFDKDFPNL